MTGKLVAALLGVAVVAGGVGGGAGWVLGRGAATQQTNAVIEMLPDHTNLAETCRKQGGRNRDTHGDRCGERRDDGQFSEEHGGLPLRWHIDRHDGAGRMSCAPPYTPAPPENVR